MLVTALADLQLEGLKSGGEDTKDRLEFGGGEEFFSILGVHTLGNIIPLGVVSPCAASEHHQGSHNWAALKVVFLTYRGQSQVLH